MSNFILVRCKREDYIKAWNYMYLSDKKKYNNNPLFDGVNPSLNKNPLKTEKENYCTVVYDKNVPTEGFEYGKPIGVFCFVVTNGNLDNFRTIIGKQFLVDPDYHGKGLGKALLIECEKWLKEKGYLKYYIGCSQCSAGIYKKYWQLEPFSSDEKHDMYKFNVDLNRENFEKLYLENIMNRSDLKVVI